MKATSNVNETDQLNQLANAMYEDLTGNLLPFWLDQLDPRGGFFSFSDHENIRNEHADKGALLHARMIWLFSRAARIIDEKQLARQCQEAAEHGVIFLKNKLLDPVYGGVYWSVDSKGAPLDTQKHLYNQAFAIYALTEWYSLTNDNDTFTLIEKLFLLIEKHGFDEEYGGYLESFDQQWQPIPNLLICDTEQVVSEKSMNTHLHIMEAYSRLYDMHPSQPLKIALRRLIEIMCVKTQNERASFAQFFNRQWEVQSINHSYGHDIEGSWLIWEAAEKVMDSTERNVISNKVLSMAESVLTYGVDYDGAVCNALIDNRHVDTTRVWWTQAEGIVGFVNAWQLSQERKFLNAASDIWRVIEKTMIDPLQGGWHQQTDRWGVVDREPKVSFWKCPYHNGRACLEILERSREKVG